MNIGDKRKKRAKVAKVKVLRRREAIRRETSKKHKQEVLDRKTKREKQPIKNIVVDQECLDRNIEVLRGIREEFKREDITRIEEQVKDDENNGEEF